MGIVNTNYEDQAYLMNHLASKEDYDDQKEWNLGPSPLAGSITNVDDTMSQKLNIDQLEGGFLSKINTASPQVETQSIQRINNQTLNVGTTENLVTNKSEKNIMNEKTE